MLHDKADPSLVAGGVAHRGGDQIDEVPLDPLPREVVGNREDERLVREVATEDVGEPRAKSRVVQRPLEPTCNLGPETLCCQLLLAHHDARTISSLGDQSGEHNSVVVGTQ